MGIIRIDQSVCTVCGCCVDICPTEAIRIVDGKARVYPEICTGCGDCVVVCPTQAISLLEPEGKRMLVPSDQMRKDRPINVTSPSVLDEVVPWAGAALILLGKNIAQNLTQNLADALIAAMEGRTSQPLGRGDQSRSSYGNSHPVGRNRGRRQRRRRRRKG